MTKIRKPILHAYDHLPGGADPLPSYSTASSDDVTRDTFGQIPDGVYAHYWRWREPDWEYDASDPTKSGTPDLAPYEDTPEGPFHAIQMSYQGAAAHGEEVSGGHAGPSAGMLAAKREWTHPLNFQNFYAWSAPPLYGMVNAPGVPLSCVGWFKFTNLSPDGTWFDVFSFGDTGDAIATRLRGFPNGSLALSREGEEWTTPAGVLKPNKWHYLAVVIGLGRVRLYVDPSAAAPAETTATIGNDFPFPGPLAMETWGLEKGDYTAGELGAKLVGAGFESIAVQLNAAPGEGRTHADYIAKLAADVTTLHAAGLNVIGWGEVDANTAADLAATGVTGWMPQIEGPSQRDNVLAALGAGVGSGMPKAVVTTYGGLDTPADVAALAAAGITAAAVESYADDGHSDISVMLAAGQSYGFDLDEMVPILGTYRGERPAAYAHFNASIIPNYGIYNVPQTSDAQWLDFASVNASGSQALWTAPLIDQPDPATEHTSHNLGLAVSSSYLFPPTAPDFKAHGFEGFHTEVMIAQWMLPGEQAREMYLAGNYGDTGVVPPTERIPMGGITPGQVAPGSNGQVLGTLGGVTTWTNPATGAVLTYHGEWDAGTEYDDGDIVVYEDRLYLCVRPTTSAPSGWA